MKKTIGRKVVLILVMVLSLPFFLNQNLAITSAATTPSFNKTKVSLAGKGKTYQLTVKDQVAKSTYKWSTSNAKVAKVSSKGLVTAVDKGTAKIKCKITYPNKKTKTLTCTVTVTIPSEQIKIANAVEVNGAHKLTVGQSFDFQCEILPANTSDVAYWSIGGGDESCIRIDDANEGKVTAHKEGKVILLATGVKKATAANAATSYVRDAIIIEVTGQTATVRSAEFTGSTEIKVVFDSPVNRDTVITSNNKLSDNITILMKKDSKGVMASDPGALTASLSADGQTLTITSTNRFNGQYGITFSNKIITTAGVALQEYTKLITYTDNVPPTILGVDMDDSGMVATIRFSEAVDITNLQVPSVTLVQGSTSTTDPVTMNTLQNKYNYILSQDKKSMTIDLSKISSLDYGKKYSVTFAGIKDLAGNAPASYTLTTVLYTDTSVKSQAVPISLIRSGHKTLTATFTRSISYGGIAILDNGSVLTGTVDSTNNRKVIYTLNDSDVTLSGTRVVTLSNWDSYNVNPNDNTAANGRKFNVDFTIEKTSPVFGYEYDPATNILTLNFNEDVKLLASSGVFSSSIKTATDDIINATNVTYTRIADLNDPRVVKLQLGNMNLAGSYTITIDQGFAVDNFDNPSLARTIQLSNTNGGSKELPGPYSVTQSQSNLSQIYLEFANKLDLASAQNVANYTIPGVNIVSAQVTKNSTDGATVVLTVGDIDVTVERPIKISGVLGYNGSYSAISGFEKVIPLKDNKKPTFISSTFDTASRNVIRLNFNEQIQGSLKVKVTQVSGGSSIEIPNNVTVSGSCASVNLDFTPEKGSFLRIEVVTNNLTDMNGNAAVLSTTGVVANY